MKALSFLIFVFLFCFHSTVYSQTPATPKLYAHKVVVDSIIQTKAYTYLKVVEKIHEKDSSQWMALPLIEAKTRDVYYYDSGLQMGEFYSKELNRKFDQILFLSFLSTSAEVSEKNIIPAPVLDTVPLNAAPAVVHTVVVKEVIQTSGYSYLRVKEGEKEDWIAIVKIPAAVGQTYTYDDAAAMNNFTSKELKRTFETILFVAKLTPKMNAGENGSTSPKKNKGEGKTKKNKSGKIEPAAGGITIAEL
ncbi:MAG: hypothetical protein NT126_07940 [Bacteroidetes bacterium]|nr:hypothetical protein [Bacteroidota bacterium]